MTAVAAKISGATITAATTVSLAWKLRLRARVTRNPLTERVTDTSDCVNQPWLALRLQLSAQVRDVHLQGIGAGPEIVAPDLLEDPGARQDHTRVAHQEFEEPELGPGELQLALAAPDLHRLQVQGDVAEPQHVLVGGSARPPQ